MIDAHRGAFEYDWRTRFHLPLKVVSRSMSWGEALRLTEALAIDPSTHVGAAMAGWDYPIPHEAIAVLDLFDLQHHIAWAQGGSKGPKPKPHTRPWSTANTSKRTKPDSQLSHDEIVAALRAAGHTAPIPPDRR